MIGLYIGKTFGFRIFNAYFRKTSNTRDDVNILINLNNMKSLLLMMSFLSVMSFTTCSKDYIPTYVEDVFVHVKEAEKVLSIYDKSVQEALDNDEIGVIKHLANNATMAVTIKLERIQELPTNDEASVLQKSAVNYLQAMFDMIKAEETYAAYTNETTLEEARKMDSYSIKARKNLEDKHQELLDARDLLESKIAAK